MSSRTNLKSRVARALAAHAARVTERDRAEWTRAMIHEQEYLPPEASALSWALGCVSVSYRGRLRAMIRLPDLPPWVLFMILLGPCANFIHIAVSTAQGQPVWPGATAFYTLMQQWLIFVPATLIGPVALLAVLWTLSSQARRPGTMFMVILWTLTALGALWVGAPALSAKWRALAAPVTYVQLFFNAVLLPALAVAQLQRLDLRRRSAAAGYDGSPLSETTNLPVKPILSAPNIRALGLGVIFYFGLAALAGWLLPHVPQPMSLITNGTILFHVVLAVCLVLPGVVLGIAAKRSPLMHGILLGVLIVSFLALLILVAGALGVKRPVEALNQLGSFAVVSATVLIFSSLGALLGDSISDKLRGA